MEYIIRPARETDMDQVHQLICELAVYEKEPQAVEIKVADLKADGFGKNPKFQCFVACKDEEVLGMALCYPRYSTWKGLVIHLEDLIVTAEARGKGLGGRLLTRVVRYAREQGARRVSWEVLDWNEPAIEFYKARGARVMRDWDVVQLDQKGINTYLDTYESL